MDDKIIFDYKTQRGTFIVELTELNLDTRDPHRDIKIKFSILCKNIDFPSWNIKFFDVHGKIKNMSDKEMLIKKIINEIKIRINRDEQGEFCIAEQVID